jgi:hypothetical protein
VKDWIQDAPLSLHGSIFFHFYLRFSPLDSILLIDRNQVGKEQRIGTLSTVFRLDTDEQKVDNLGFMELDSAQQMPPAKRKQPAPMTLLRALEREGIVIPIPIIL